MRVKKRRNALFAVAFVFTAPALAEEVKQEAVIVSRSDNGLNVRTRQGP